MTLNSTNMTIESGMTLNKMLGDHNEIVIPIIQRDYAQGRKNAKEIRSDFLRDIFCHLKEGRAIKLSFVYGTTIGCEYVPYDGQQRLTLIYLLTVFLSAYCKCWESLKKLSRFKYFTRDNATAFCHFLTAFDDKFDDGQKNVFQRICIQDKKNIGECITNDTSFFGSWIYDPTVNSMVVVLQSIQNEFVSVTDELDSEARISKAESFLRQIEDGKIFFDWCSIQASDNIYIKMNGRGKPLSAFDNFKNTLYSELNKLRKRALANGEESKVDFLSKFEEKMDGKWTGLFWKNRNIFVDQENYDIAPYIMNFFYYVFELRHTIKCNGFFFGGKESFKWIDEKNIVTFLVRFKDLCEVNDSGKKGEITLDDYIWASKILDVISDRLLSQSVESLAIENYSSETQLLKEISSHKGSVCSSRSVIVASLYYEYLVNASVFDASGELLKTDCSCRDQWMNLISRLVKTASVFKARYDALLRDKHILSGFANIFIPTIFAKSGTGDLIATANEFDEEKLRELKPYFDVSHVYSQLVEEIRKYQLIGADPNSWPDAIKSAEKDLPLFGNMIYFLIQLSENSGGGADVNLFTKYLNLMKQVVNEKEIVEQNFFTAIMLSYADYRISCGEGFSNSWSLCSNGSNGTFSWRYFFDVLDGEIAEKGKTKVDVIKYALDLIDACGNVKSAYNSIKTKPDDVSWRSVIVRYPEILDLGSIHRIVHRDDENWYLIKSDGVVKQVHSNSLVDSVNIELYGLYKSSKNSDRFSFNTGKICIGSECFIRKDKDYVIHDKDGDKHVCYADALAFLDSDERCL